MEHIKPTRLIVAGILGGLAASLKVFARTAAPIPERPIRRSECNISFYFYW